MILDLLSESVNILNYVFKMDENISEDEPDQKKIKTSDEIVRLQDLIEIKKLPSGQFSTIGLYINSVNNKKYVLKRYMDSIDHSSETELQKELNHPYIADYVISDNITSKTLITRFYENQDLLEYCLTNSSFDFSKIFYQLAIGLKYLKSQMILHRDIKPENIFLDENLIPKIGDFGFAVKLDGEYDRASKVCGTILYCAPEIIHTYTYSIDVWSLGVLYYSITCGRNPFHECHLRNYSYQDYRKRLTFSKTFKKELKDLIRKMLNPDANERIIIENVCEDLYFQRYQ